MLLKQKKLSPVMMNEIKPLLSIFCLGKSTSKEMLRKAKSMDYDEIVVSNFEIVYAFVAKTEYLKQFKFPIKVLPYDELDTKKSVLKDYLKEIQKKEAKI